MVRFFNSLSLSVRIITAAVLTLVVVVAINYVVFLSGYRHDAQQALMDKASGFTALADEAKNHASRLIAMGAIDVKTLAAEAVEGKNKGEDISKTKFFNTIPVVVGWTTAREAAKREGLDFKVPAFQARNPKNEPEAGSFRAALLKDLEAQVKGGGKDSLGRIDTATNTLHFMRAIKLDESCMMCHGDPAVHGVKDENGKATGFDALGYRMENWKPGDTHGAFEISMPLADMDSDVAAFFKNGMMYTVPVVAGAVFALWFLLRVLLVKPIGQLIGMIKDVATGDGDLTKRIGINRGDEIGQLGHWFDAFLNNIHGIVKEVSGTTRQVAAAATEIASSAEQMAAGMKQQQEQTQQVSAAVEEMSASVVEVAKKSSEAATAAADSGKQADGGGKVVGQTVMEMKGIAEQVNESAAAVNELGKKGEKIGEIIGVINDIADQTNLLALNAAIEAARAGEHGRGFAVVADEVRKLAERTTQATEEVAKSIREIQADTGTAVQTIQAGSQKVTAGVELANNAGEALQKIVASSQSLQSMVQSIAAAAEEQSSASEQIARSVETISSVTKESTEGANQAASAATALSQQAETLQKLVGRFKV